MQLEVSPYLLVDTLRDWLVVQITSTAGVNVYRAKSRDKAEPHYEAIKASGSYHMLALMNEDGECIASGHKPRIVNNSWAKEVVKPKLKLPEPINDPNRLPYGHPDTPEGKAHGIAPVKPVDLSGFTTGLPSGFKTGK